MIPPARGVVYYCRVLSLRFSAIPLMRYDASFRPIPRTPGTSFPNHEMNGKPAKMLSTSMIAAAVRCHPNTVRLYEKWGYLQPVPRGRNGYRLYSEKHLRQMRLARTALPGPYPGGGACVYRLVREAAQGRFDRALECARLYRENVRRETKRAHSVLEGLEKWARSSKRKNNKPSVCSRRRAAGMLSLTIDALRTWERNGLLRVRKNKLGHCSYSAADVSRLRIIRALRTAGFSLASIHTMLLEYDSGAIRNISRRTLARILDTPSPDAPIVYVPDMWLTTLSEHRKRATSIIKMLTKMHKE